MALFISVIGCKHAVIVSVQIENVEMLGVEFETIRVSDKFPGGVKPAVAIITVAVYQYLTFVNLKFFFEIFKQQLHSLWLPGKKMYLVFSVDCLPRPSHRVFARLDGYGKIEFNGRIAVRN